MDENVGVGVGPAARAHHAGGGGPAPAPVLAKQVAAVAAVAAPSKEKRAELGGRTGIHKVGGATGGLGQDGIADPLRPEGG
jgi:hypothetical protein